MRARAARRGRRALPAAALFGAIALWPGCRGEAAPGPWTEEGDHRWRALHPRGSGGFARLDAPRHGVRFAYDVPEERRTANRVLAEGAGVAIGDVDGDGLADLFFAGFGGGSRLYRNLGGWRFEDMTQPAGLSAVDGSARGAALADVDGDGHLDLLVLAHGAPDRLWRGDGAGRFAAVEGAGFEAARASTTAALSDIDGDGDLDLYVASYKTAQVDDLFPPAALDINRLRPGPDGEIRIPPELADLYETHYRVEFDGRFVRRFELGEPDELYINEGEGRFRAAPAGERFRDIAGRPLSRAPREWGLTARFSDWDGDGDPDLYVANDFNSPDGIWINAGDGTFDEAPASSIRTTSLSSMAVEAADLDRDGDLDLVTTDMLALDPAARLAQTPNFRPEAEPPGVVETRVQVNRNAVQLNRGDGTFAEVAHELGLAASDWTWGALVMDVDLDGLEDLLVTTGHVWNPLDGDANARIFGAGAVAGPQALRMLPELRQPNLAFRGRPEGAFEDVTDGWGWGGEADISHGIASGDLDADGDLDVVVTRFADPPVLYRNESGAPRVLVRLRGPAGNSRGIGARVRLGGHAVGEQIDEIAAGGTYLSSSEPAVAFAAAASAPMTLVVDWPDGRRSTVEGVVANREYEIYHEGASPPPPRAGGSGAPHFLDVSAALAHRHAETPFDDRARQPLLPHSLSRLGPGLAWVDADRDGDPDLVIGSGRGGAVALRRNEGDGRFTPLPLWRPPSGDATAIVPLARRGGLDLVIGSSNYEADSPEAALAAPAAHIVPLPLAGRAAGGLPATPLGPPPGADRRAPSATGPLAQADVDGDGDLDLFVGGRVVAALYPLPADAQLFRNEAGALVPDSGAAATFARLGLVSGAVFTDFDGDGDPDLALVLDWGSIRLFENEAGRFRDVTEAAGLGSTRGRWNGIAAGDFDGDGRLDLVATGWGRNLEVPSAYSLFFGDFNRDGLFDLVEGVREGDRWRPLRPRDDLARPLDAPVPGLPHLASVSYAEYGRAELTRLIPSLDTTARLDAVELRHTVFLNRQGGFEARPLPTEAQRAPAFGVAVSDFDGDGDEDLLLAQNFYAGRRDVPRYDAGRGLWLEGDGTGGFAAVPGHRSGIAVYGGGRGLALADFDRDGRVDAAFGVNGTDTRLYRNLGATPGLRVRLEGPPANPEAIGARLRIEFEDGSLGPAREVRSGGGYWSRDEAVQTLGLRARPVRLQVVWPGGRRQVVEVPAGATELRVRAPDG